MDSIREEHGLRRENRVLRAFVRGLRHLVDAAERRGNGIDVLALLGDVVQSALEMTEADDGSLLALDEETGELLFAAVRGVMEDSLIWRRIPPGKGVAGWVARNRRAAIVNEPQEDERFYGNLDAMSGFRTLSLLAAPLMGDGRMLGVIEVVNKQGEKLFTTADQEMLTLFCRIAGELLYRVLEKDDLARQNEHVVYVSEKQSFSDT